MNACLVDDLIDLNAVESAPVIERAFAAKKVMPILAGDWDEVQVSLGLKTREEVPIRRFTLKEMSEALGIEQPVSEPRGFAKSTITKKKSAKKSKKRR
ncbi:hypothetical protein RIVM261_076490 [Rivularia sp. IAM M-261]|nr:hypothetical protein RIVM261_076490 [Rivularia sp. IAM M-261]